MNAAIMSWPLHSGGFLLNQHFIMTATGKLNGGIPQRAREQLEGDPGRGNEVEMNRGDDLNIFNKNFLSNLFFQSYSIIKISFFRAIINITSRKEFYPCSLVDRISTRQRSPGVEVGKLELFH